MAIEQWLIDSPKTIDLEVVRHVRAGLMNGSLNVIAHDEPGCRVEVAALSGRNLKVSIDGDTLLINHPQLDWNELGDSARAIIDQPSAEVSVLVPKNVDVNVKATGANVLVVGIDGDVSITTIGGEHFCDRTGGKLTLTSAAGELSVRDHRGSVDAKTATGDVTVTGAITSFAGNTISGSTVVDVAGSAPSRISNVSVSGSTTVRLPEATNPVVTVSSVSSKAQIGTRIIEPQFAKSVTVGEAADGEPFTEVRVSTVAGRTVVLREGAAWPGDTDAADSNTAGNGGAFAAATTPDAGAPADAPQGDQLGGVGNHSGYDAPFTGAPAATPADHPQGDQLGGVGNHSDSADGAAANAASWRIGDNPNIDLSQAPKPTFNVVPPVQADDADTATPASASEPGAPFEPGDTRTASEGGQQ